jgi:hypothetical protein
MHRFFLPFTLIAATLCHSHQAMAQITPGSVAEFNLLRQMNNRAADAAMNWRDSKKITHLKELPEGPKSQSECLYFAQLKNGDTGYLSYWSPKVRSVIDDEKMLIGLDNPNIAPVCFTGFPTADFIDGDSVKIVGMVEVDGTFEYTTVLGAKKKVYKIKLCTPEREKEILLEREQKKKELQQQMEIAEMERKKAEREASFHTWTSSDGNFTVEAIFIDFKDGKVLLEKRDESVIEVSPAVLSREDRDYYRDLIMQRREAAIQQEKEAANPRIKVTRGK